MFHIAHPLSYSSRMTTDPEETSNSCCYPVGLIVMRPLLVPSKIAGMLYVGMQKK